MHIKKFCKKFAVQQSFGEMFKVSPMVTSIRLFHAPALSKKGILISAPTGNTNDAVTDGGMEFVFPVNVSMC